MFGAYVLLFVAIGTEVAATSSLPRSNMFRDPFWSLVVVGGYALSAWLLAIAVNKIPVSTAYAVWAGLGTAGIALIGALWLGESWNWVKVVALTMIIAGLVMLNLQDAHGA